MRSPREPWGSPTWERERERERGRVDSVACHAVAVTRHMRSGSHAPRHRRRHSHHNESDSTAWVLPIQDAGLYTHQRTLDIRFSDDEVALLREGRIRGTAFSITNKQYYEVVSTHQAALDAADDAIPNFNYGL